MPIKTPQDIDKILQEKGYMGPEDLASTGWIKFTGDKRFPGQFFSPSKGKLQGLPVTALINLIYDAYPYCTEYPYLLELEISFTNPQEDGQCTPEEYDRLLEAEADFCKQMNDAGAAVHIIARQTWNGKRMIDCYTDKEDIARQVLEQCKKNTLSGRALSYKISNDPTWQTYAAFTKHFID